MLKWARIPLVVAATVFPVVFAKRIENMERAFLLGFFSLVLCGAVVEVVYDREVLKELEKAQRGLQFQKARGLAMQKLLGLISPLMAVVQNRASLTSEQRNSATLKVDESIEEVLKAVCEDVWIYWNDPGSTAPPVRGSVMLAYEISSMKEELFRTISGRVKFMGFGRKLDSYKYVLDVKCWSHKIPQFGPVAVPVEDPNTAEGRAHLLPGAPYAFVSGEDVVLCDTHGLRTYAPELDPKLLQQEVAYFDSQKIRSMACLPLREKGEQQQNRRPIGVVNIHSESVNIFGTRKEEQRTIIESLQHYVAALEYLIDGQRQLMA